MATVRDDVIPTLERSALFAGLSRDQIRTIAERFDDSTYLAAHSVLTEGLAGPDFFVSLDGEADVIVDGVVVHHLGPGDFFGEWRPLTANSAPPASRRRRGCAASPWGTAASVNS